MSNPISCMVSSSCNTLSRLKGIETSSPAGRCSRSDIFCLLYTFPFEGNWNQIFIIISLKWSSLLYTFPFEGNWNVWRCCEHTIDAHLLYTFPFEGNWNLSKDTTLLFPKKFLAIHFPVWRELKLTKWTWYDITTTCYTLSRLKGIETCLGSHIDILRCDLAIHFPVWRELKHFFSLRFWYQPSLLYTFPFEGNWNIRINSFSAILVA